MRLFGREFFSARNSYARVTTPGAERARERLLLAAAKKQEDLFDYFETDMNGYDEDMADRMREYYGPNKLTKAKKESMARKVFGAFVNPFTVVLFVLAAISLATDVIAAKPGMRDPSAVIIIMTMITVSGLLRFVQEARSGQAAEKLSEMVETTIAVKRLDEDRKEIPIDEIVAGDILYLAAGDMVPADVRVVKAKDLFVSQASLTGESEPVEKYAHTYNEENSRGKNPLDYNNLAFMGSNVISGSATALVIAVGDDTVFGGIAQRLQAKKDPTSFEKGVNGVSWVLIRFMMVMAPVVLFVNGFTKGDWMEAALFALSVAVGLTPEMLPMIVSANLAKGASAMSKKKVIVKNLNSIQNFGAMDILCTDKTGTLTQDRVTLLRSMDVHGNEDQRVLRHAYLNSYYQTGLKNLMDIAIIKYATERGLVDAWHNYRKMDEIPFDFNRRRMSVVVANGKTQLICKGAIEEMLQVSGFAEYRGEVVPLTDELKSEIRQTVAQLNLDGLRVLGISQKSNPSPVGAFSVADEQDMVLMGYLAFLDPPKESTERAIRALSEYGVGVKILTGDNDSVTRCVCLQVGLPAERILLGSEAEELDDEALAEEVERTTVFAKLSPAQKVRIVAALRRNGHTVGYMGDGINDAAALKEADVGISVDNAVDIAKESADIILLEKDLMVLEQGVIEGRKTYANTIKYIKMTASSNFGNMFSVLAASACLPFLPMLPIQILTLNLLYDISCITIPFDNVDASYLRVPRRWDPSSISRFMMWIGPASSVFDVTTYLLLYFLICPAVFGGSYHTLGAQARLGFMALFHTGWFVESLWSQTLVIHMIRTPRIPFVQSRASWKVTAMTTLGIVVGTLIPYTSFGRMVKMNALPAMFFPLLAATILGYMALVTALKKVFVKRYGELL
ncbi:MAG: magnesium-translocating P-type ATPase [Oscillospiraceae bacterium]|jgi:Mg2+-importing ATPase|nr:magnesium-translocating P-type ATPase [Oscillospiraceae bacterium]